MKNLAHSTSVPISVCRENQSIHPSGLEGTEHSLGGPGLDGELPAHAGDAEHGVNDESSILMGQTCSTSSLSFLSSTVCIHSPLAPRHGVSDGRAGRVLL